MSTRVLLLLAYSLPRTFLIAICLSFAYSIYVKIFKKSIVQQIELTKIKRNSGAVRKLESWAAVFSRLRFVSVRARTHAHEQVHLREET